MKEYDLGVLMGRFQPIHRGHIDIIKQALKQCDELLILVGSANLARSCKNPFTFSERESLIRASFKKKHNKRIEIRPMKDYLFDDKWVKNTTYEIDLYRSELHDDGCCTTVLFGHHKDESSYYLDKFPQYDYKELDSEYMISSTDIRNYMYEGQLGKFGDLRDLCLGKFPLREKATILLNEITEIGYSETFQDLRDEFNYIQSYKKEYESLEYPPNFVTVDAVIYNSKWKQVLMIKRGGVYGKGLLAFPGGFVNSNETIMDALVREVMEETNIDITKIEDYKNKLEIGKRIVDNPNRSLRGRVISHVYFIDVADQPISPSFHDNSVYYQTLHDELFGDEIRSGDDAEQLDWYPIYDLIRDQTQIFSDHGLILEEHLGGSWVKEENEYPF